MKIITIDSSAIAGTAGNSTTGQPAPGPQPGTPAPEISTVLKPAMSQVSNGSAPAIAPTHGEI